MLLVCRFAVGDGPAAAAFRGRVRRAVELLGAQDGCRRAIAGPATEDGGRWVLVAEFDDVAGYRRALSPFPVREHVIPLLSEAETGAPAVYETLLSSTDGEVVERSSLIAADAGTIGLGEAAGPSTPRH
ncbi:MAG TPA: antibiotic biosynthesis monooxygenase [Pseudonocardiaceae bacterium]